MDMWNYLIELYQEKCITIEEMEEILNDPKEAFKLWQEFCDDEGFSIFVQEEVKAVLKYLKIKEYGDNDN